jgi:hypothetical protein
LVVPKLAIFWPHLLARVAQAETLTVVARGYNVSDMTIIQGALCNRSGTNFTLVTKHPAVRFEFVILALFLPSDGHRKL